MTDSDALAELLRRAGLSGDVHALDELLAGIDAAPEGRDPEAWLALIGSDLPPALADAFQARRAARRKPGDIETMRSNNLRGKVYAGRQRAVRPAHLPPQEHPGVARGRVRVQRAP